MIITRSPLRITLGGGGTDLPSYYERHGGFLIAAAIDRYVYVTIHDNFSDDLIVKYSRLERVPSAECIEHPLIRESLGLLGLDGRSMEISSMADIPAGTGLGSSGSFTTALLKALHTYKKNLVHPQELAEQACHIEIERLGEATGKQDQYISAYGGVTCFDFPIDDPVQARPLAAFGRDALRPGGQPAALLHGLRALGVDGAARAERPIARRRRRGRTQPDRAEGHRLRHRAGAPRRRPARASRRC